MSHKVTLAGLNTTFEVEDDETILDAALRQNIDIPYSCYSGICTTCKATCVTGQYDYGDFEIHGIDVDDNPDNELLLCSAFAKSDMVVHHPDLAPLPLEQTAKQGIQCDVIDRKPLSKHLTQIRLHPKSGSTFEYWPGQYLLIEHNDDDSTSPFSIANATHEKWLELHVFDPSYHPLSTALQHTLMQHEQVVIQGPLGSAYLHENTDAPIIFIAGGSGFAAIKPMIEHLFHTHTKRQMILYWGARHSQYLYFDRQVKLWQKKHDNFTYIPVISTKQQDWSGRTGLVHQAVIADYQDVSPYHIYLAGPSEMAFTARDSLLLCGADKTQIFSDAFEFENTTTT